jgi:hypothetical protein
MTNDINTANKITDFQGQLKASGGAALFGFNSVIESRPNFNLIINGWLSCHTPLVNLVECHSSESRSSDSQSDEYHSANCHL